MLQRNTFKISWIELEFSAWILFVTVDDCTRELKVPANELLGYEKTQILFWDKKLLKRIDKNNVRKWFLEGRRSDITFGYSFV